MNDRNAGRLTMSSAHSMNARKCVHAQKPYPNQAFAHESSKVAGRKKRETGKTEARRLIERCKKEKKLSNYKYIKNTCFILKLGKNLLMKTLQSLPTLLTLINSTSPKFNLQTLVFIFNLN